MLYNSDTNKATTSASAENGCGINLDRVASTSIGEKAKPVGVGLMMTTVPESCLKVKKNTTGTC